MAFYKYFIRVSKDDVSKKTLPALKEIKMADEAVAKALEFANSLGRGKYNSCSGQKRTQIGHYAADHGPTKAAAHFSSLWKIHINELTARRLKSEYLEALNKACEEASRDTDKSKEAVTVETLETKERKRPLILGRGNGCCCSRIY